MSDDARRQDASQDPRAWVDTRIDTPGREGLTGTAAANRYAGLHDREQITIAPDWRPVEDQPAWRRDFPIDWPEDQYVERREFMKFMVLTSAALTAGQFWIAARSWWRRRGPSTGLRVATLSDIAVGEARTFSYPGEHDDCFLVRTRERELLAYSQKCTHLSCAVRPLVDRGVIHCPCHEGYFDLQTGRPIAGPPQRPLPIVHLEIRGDDVYAVGVEPRPA